MEIKVKAYLGLGANLGDRTGALRGAREALQRQPAIDVTVSSPLYETAPVGGPAGQPPYLNAALEIETIFNPERLLETCQQIENDFGRERRERWDARTLDIDLLFFDTLICLEPELILPHPRLHERAFVLAPLADIAPDLLHPVVHLSTEELLLRLDCTEGVQKIAEVW